MVVIVRCFSLHRLSFKIEPKWRLKAVASKFASFINTATAREEEVDGRRFTQVKEIERRSEVKNQFPQNPDKSSAFDDRSVANILRACGDDKFAFHFVEQIHAKIIQCGLAASLLVCNPLVDLYLKNEFINSAFQVFDEMCKRDSVTWVAMISGLSKSGRNLEAVLLYSKMRKFGVYPTPYVFSSIISACTKIDLFEAGVQVHALIFKFGFPSELFVCNALIAFYCRLGDLKHAELIFIEMEYRDEVSYNTLISGLASQGSAEQSIALFWKMQYESLKPNCVTVASLLGSCALLGDIRKGIQLHAYAIKEGMCSDVIVEGSVLDFYVKCADIRTAHKFFLTARNDNVVLWNVMLVAYGQMGDLEESLRIFSQMQINGLQPNQHTYPSILRTCTYVGNLSLGEQLHTQVIKNGLHPNAYVCSVLIDMYAKLGNLEKAQRIFRRLEEDDVISWTAMIACYTQHDMFAEALKLFMEMQKRGIRSDNIGFASVITASAGIQALDMGRQIHATSVIFGYSSDVSIGNALVCLYARCGRVSEAYASFEKISNQGSISWSGLISGFVQSGHSEEALKVFLQMIRAQEEANMFTYGSTISAAANSSNIIMGQQIHGRISKTGYAIETEVCNALITLYAKCGHLESAWRVFSNMPQRNEVSWNAMITGYSQHGYCNQAIELFLDMKRLKIKPNHITFVGVLSACSHVGLVEEGLGYFESMAEEHGLVPKPEHYACAVDILGRDGQLARAKAFVDAMPVRSDAMVWRTLLSACLVHKNMDIGEFAANRLLELEPNDSATYVLMSNMYAIAGKWDLRDRARQLMRDRGVKKEPGQSYK